MENSKAPWIILGSIICIFISFGILFRNYLFTSSQPILPKPLYQYKGTAHYDNKLKQWIRNSDYT